MPRQRKEVKGCSMDMTPMIDVVFQLIIFFIVCMNMTKQFNEDIRLADGRHGDAITSDLRDPFEIEVDQRGRVSIRGIRWSHESLHTMLKNRVARMGPNFPVLIRGDSRATHEDMKRVMDLCTMSGIWQLSFIVVEKRANQR